MLNRPLPAPARDLAMLVARVILGVVLFAHGWQKLMINGISGTYGQFEKLGIPLAIVSASFASFVEFVGGVLIVLGALTTTVVALDLVVMVGAAGFVHMTHGIFAQNGGWELVGVIVAAELALAAFGPGRFSVDHLIARHHDRERAEMQRREQAPVIRAAAVSETFTPAADLRPGGFAIDPASAGMPTGGFAAVGPAVPTGAFAAVAPLPGRVPTGGFATVAPVAAGAPTGRFAAAGAPGEPTDGFATVAPVAAGAPTGRSAVSVGEPTGAFRAVRPPTPATDQPATEAFAVVPDVAATAGPVGVEDAGSPTDRVAVDPSPRMASAGVHRALSERAAASDRPAPAPFGVTVQSPLDFTPTTALPVVTPSHAETFTDTITVATSVPGGLPRRVRAVDLPPASAVRPYA